MRDLRASGDQSGRGVWEVDSGSILGLILVNSGPILDPSLGNLIISLHLAVGRGLKAKYVEYGVREARRVVPRYSTLPVPTRPTPRVHPSRPTATPRLVHGYSGQSKYGRGAHIRRRTLFMGPDLRVQDYYRGL